MKESRFGSVEGLASFSRDLQVRYHGIYSSSRLQALAKYHSETSLVSAIIVLTASLVPALVVTVCADSFHLEPLSAPLSPHPRFLARLAGTNWVFSILGLMQFRHYVTAIYFSNLHLTVLATIVAASSTGICYLLARGIGFPVPFTLFTGCCIGWAPCMILAQISVGVLRVYRNEQQRPHLIHALRLWVGQFVLAGIYPLYFCALLATPARARPAVMLVLPLMKVIIRNGFSRALPHLRDEGPEVVTFNTDVFSSLFTAFAAQSTTMLLTIGLMVLDAIRVLMSIREMFQMHRELQVLQGSISFFQRESMRPAFSSTEEITQEKHPSRLNMLDTAVRMYITHPKPSLAAAQRHSLPSPTFQLLNLRSGVAPIALNPVKPFLTTRILRSNRVVAHAKSNPWVVIAANTARIRSSAKVSSQDTSLMSDPLSVEIRYAEQVQRFLHLMEYTLLLNYVELVVPFIYGCSVKIAQSLPNRAYYPAIAHLDTHGLELALLNVFLYFVAQVCSLSLICIIYHFKFQVSGIKHIAFVLKHQWVGVQTKLIFWVFYNAQGTLVHFGNDYSFRFQWLHTGALPPTPTTNSSNGE